MMGFDALYARERDDMVRMAALIVGSGGRAEEIVHDAFEQVSRRWEEIERPGGYLRTSVLNGCRAELRRRERHRRLDRLQPPVRDIELPSHLIELADALARLPEQQRTIVVLRYLLDLPDAEIAESLGVTPATVRSTAHRALSALRKELM